MIYANDPVAEEILFQGVEDYVALTVITSLVVDEIGEESNEPYESISRVAKERTLSTCEFLLSRELMTVGSLSNNTQDPDDFVPWKGTVSQLITRIDRDWDALVSLDNFEPCWFKRTDAGTTEGTAIAANTVEQQGVGEVCEREVPNA